MTRKVLRRLHFWIGVVLTAPLIVLAVTGLIMAADPFVAAIEGVPSTNTPLTAPEDKPAVDVAATLSLARAAVSGDLVPIRWRLQPDLIVAVDFAARGHQQAAAQVAADTLFGRVLWVRRDVDGFYRWVHSVHQTLLLGSFGRGIVGWVGIGLVVLGLTGIPLWWPARGRWQAAFTLDAGASGWRFHRALHGATGIWLALLLLLQSLSGITMAFPQTMRAILGLPRPASNGLPGAKAEFDPVHAIVAGVAAADAVVPGAILRDLRLPAVPGRPMIALLVPNGGWAGSPSAIVSMDPATARVLSVQDPTVAATGASVLNWLRAIHQGGAGGPIERVLLCLFAVALPLLPVSGVTMWMLRRRKRQPATSWRDSPETHHTGVV